MVVDDADVVWR